MKINKEKVEKLKVKRLKHENKRMSLEKKLDLAKDKLSKANIHKIQKVRHGVLQGTANLVKNINKLPMKALKEGANENDGAKVGAKIYEKSIDALHSIASRFSKKGRIQAQHKKIQRLSNKIQRQNNKILGKNYKIAKQHLKVSDAYMGANKFQQLRMKTTLKRSIYHKKSVSEKAKELYSNSKKLIKRTPNKIQEMKKILSKRNMRKVFLNARFKVKTTPQKVLKKMQEMIIRLISRIFFYIKVGLVMFLIFCVLIFVQILFTILGGATVTTTYSNSVNHLLTVEENLVFLEDLKIKEIRELPKKYPEYDEVYVEYAPSFIQLGEVSHDPHLFARYLNLHFGIFDEDVPFNQVLAFVHEYFKTIYTFEEKESTRIDYKEEIYADEKGMLKKRTVAHTVKIMTVVIHKKDVEKEFDAEIAASKEEEVKNFYEALRKTEGNYARLFDDLRTIRRPQFTLKGKDKKFTYAANRGRGLPKYNPNASEHGALGHCTAYVYDVLATQGIQVSQMGNARHWAENAQKQGYSVNRTIRVGTVAVFDVGVAGASSPYGHVAIVTAIRADGSFEVSEMNGPHQLGGGLGKINTRLISREDAQNTVFIDFTKPRAEKRP